MTYLSHPCCVVDLFRFDSVRNIPRPCDAPILCNWKKAIWGGGGAGRQVLLYWETGIMFGVVGVFVCESPASHVHPVG